MDLKLPYHHLIFTNLIETPNNLTILSPGLGLTRILSALIDLYGTQKYTKVVGVGEGMGKVGGEKVVEEVRGLVFLINVDWDELAPYIVTQTKLVMVDNTTLAAERQELYRRGGMIAITSRILVVDLLCQRVPIPLVTGFIMANAHQILPDSSEAFILRVYRQQNKLGFIKALSDRPDLFVGGFSPLERTMKLLFVRTVFLWPRFQVEVAQCLEAHPIKVIELHQPLTKKMQLIQASIMDCLNSCLMELRRSKLLREVEDDLTLDFALNRNFDRMLRTQLDSVWYRLGYSIKELISDIAILRKLLTYLTSYDAVSFLKYLDTIIALNSSSGQNSSFKQPSSWLMTDAANTLLISARARVYTKQDSESIPVLEEQPKWPLIRQLLDEIQAELKGEAKARVMITTIGARSCRMIRDYLCLDTRLDTAAEKHPMLLSLFRSYNAWKLGTKPGAIQLNKPLQPISTNTAMTSNVRRPPAQKRRRVRGGGSSAPGAHQTTIGMWTGNSSSKEPNSDKDTSCEKGEDVSVEDLEELPFDVTQFNHHFGLVTESSNISILVQSVSGDLDDLALSEFRPTHIVMADPDPGLIRRVEAYQAEAYQPATHQTLTVYFLMYSDSVEEQRFLASVRREKDGFERLIREKANVVIPLDYGSTRPSIERILDTRNAGGQVATLPRTQVVIDVREFRAALPSALYAAGLDIIPVTIQIGDYILSPTLCVERKAIPDLISSISSGRLYTQVEIMTKYYPTPILLIEFDEAKSFSLDVLGDQGSEFHLANIPSKLVLLSLTFPQLKIIWSSSPAQTAQIFINLKNGHPEPDVDTCMRLGNSEEDAIDQDTNIASVALLQSLPGITKSNIRNVMDSVTSIAELTTKSLSDLQNLIGVKSGEKLFHFFNDLD